MTSMIFRNARKRLRLSQAGLARLLGVAPNTVARMERGEQGISEPLARLLLFIMRDVEAKSGYAEYLATTRRSRRSQ